MAGDRSPGAHEDINSAFEELGSVNPKARRELLAEFVVESIRDANERRLSLAILSPLYEPLLRFDHNRNSPESPWLRLFDDSVPQVTEGHRRFAFTPRLEFADAGGHHSLTLRDWGCFEFLRKHGDERRHELATALHLGPESSLLVGNMNHHRTSWLVISVLNGIRAETPPVMPTLFDVAS